MAASVHKPPGGWLSTSGQSDGERETKKPVVSVTEAAASASMYRGYQNPDSSFLEVPKLSASDDATRSDLTLSSSGEYPHTYTGVPVSPQMASLIREHFPEFAKLLIAEIGEMFVDECPQVDLSEMNPWEGAKKLVAHFACDMPYVEPSTDLPGDLKLIRGFRRFIDMQCPKLTAVNTPRGLMHANRVRMPDGCKYICSQAPTQHFQEHFWLTAKDKAGLIIDLTRLAIIGDDGKVIKDAEIVPYYPSSEEPSRVIGYTKVSFKKQVASDDKTKLKSCDVLEYAVHGPMDKEPFTVWRMHYSGWPDYNGVTAEVIHSIICEVEEWRKTSKTEDREIIVHCRAGMGRTGTLIVATTLYHLWQAGKLEKKKVPGLVMALMVIGRMQRGPHFVQDPRQMLTLYEYGKFLCDLKKD